MGKFYDNGRIYENGLLKGKKALLSITTGDPEKNYVTTKYGSIDQTQMNDLDLEENGFII
ncbi:hypothetical protein ASG31_16820 [Chryseobacterium sp. Leaf404]|nr:hypothetical protein ASG31_16820 [Chryseobacterium sp. Leaf404]